MRDGLHMVRVTSDDHHFFSFFFSFDARLLHHFTLPALDARGLAGSKRATRLGYFLLRRITEDGGVDSRFNGVRDNPPKFFVFWTIQAVWILAQSLPVLIAQQLPTTPPPSPTATQKSATEKHSGNHGERMTPADWVGRGLYLAGFALEVIADQQKRTFRSDIANRGTFITTGLWSISRHPNYLGEIMLWWGVFLRAFPVLRERAAFVAAGAVSPLFITFLLTKVSGIPLLERAAQKRWGTDIAYQAYKNSTAILLPGVW